MAKLENKSVAVIVAHPNDETLWVGGTILSHPHWRWFVVCLCNESDKDKAPRFHKALKALKVDGIMGDLDDGTEHNPLDEKLLNREIQQLLPPANFDLVITHNPNGEIIRNMRHEEVSKAVILLWHTGKISTNELWTFNYSNEEKEYLSNHKVNASFCRKLTSRVWHSKCRILKETYGFNIGSSDAETAPETESFWKFTDPDDAKKWIKNCENVTGL